MSFFMGISLLCPTNIILAVLLTQVLGFIWYNPKFFGRLWMTGLSDEEFSKKSMFMGIGFNVIGFSILATIMEMLNNLLKHTPGTDPIIYWIFTVGLSCGFVVLGYSNHVFEKRHMAFRCVVAGHTFLSSVIVAVTIYSLDFMCPSKVYDIGR